MKFPHPQPDTAGENMQNKLLSCLSSATKGFNAMRITFGIVLTSPGWYALRV